MASVRIFFAILVLSYIAAAEKVCPGFGTPELSRHGQLDQSNIDFFKNCTVIDGDLIIKSSTFRGDRFMGIVGIDPFQLEVFNSLRNITGYLAVLASGESQESLSALSNLQVIEGRTLLQSDYSLVIMDTALTSLGLNSLRSIENGNVYIRRNAALCYVKSGLFENTGIFYSGGQSAHVRQNRPKDLCRVENHVCDRECTDLGCWGPGINQCGTCKNYKLDGICVDSCDADAGLYVLSEEDKECGHDEEFEVDSEVGPGSRTWDCDPDDVETCFNECQATLQEQDNVNAQLRAEVEELRNQLRDARARKQRLQRMLTTTGTQSPGDD
ncbi:epidermal growth factor receptor-like [Ptychodera flava]|uniref:epidermal growth factor receptor-like n=1 Tax=Ptychodera flava TaxID=63121 RepID=UPI00396A8728